MEALAAIARIAAEAGDAVVDPAAVAKAHGPQAIAGLIVIGIGVPGGVGCAVGHQDDDGEMRVLGLALGPGVHRVAAVAERIDEAGLVEQNLAVDREKAGLARRRRRR